ncbi:MAG: PAS domain S-box protein [Acidobacteriota bacterium]
MISVPVPQIGALRSPYVRTELNTLDRTIDPALDELAQLAAVLTGADYAYIAWLDFDRLWFKAQSGFTAAEQPRASTPCQWVLDRGEPLLIADASEESPFRPEGIPLMGAEPCRSYAGIPLFSSGRQSVGTLAVLAREPRRFKPEQLEYLKALGRQVMTRVELYSRIRAQEQAQCAWQRTERALAVERCFVAATLDSIPALIMVLDTAGRVVRLNHSCAHLTGLSLADLVGGLFVEEVLDTRDRPWATEIVQEAAEGLVSGPHETVWKVAGGAGSPCPTRRVSWTLRPLLGPNGEIQYLIVVGQDVTDQRQKQLTLYSSEARYRVMVENSLGFVFTCSMEGRVTAVNALTAETLGYRPEALVGRSILELMNSASASAYQDCLRVLNMFENEDWQRTLQLRRSDGVHRRIAFHSRRVQLPGERPFVLNYGMDMTEHYEAEEALNLSTRQREMILEAVGDGIFGIDLDGRVTFVNRAGARALGHLPDHLVGRDVHSTIHHSHADGTPYSKSTSPILQALRLCEPIRMRDEIFWRKDGTPIPVEYSANPLIEEGRVLGMVVAFQDVSERRRLERMKDEFISAVSHELRTPLTSLRASLGLIASGSLDKRPEKQQQMLDVAIGNSDRLIRLVNDIVDFESVEKGRLHLHRESMGAVELLRRAADVAHGPAMKAQIDFRIDAPEVEILADKTRALQVLNELIDNAIKFSRPETTIRLSASPVEPQVSADASASSGEVCFVVEDQGAGIPEEKLEHIFDRFQRGDASDSCALGGTGLGLALCRSIVEQHGGRIWAKSEPGKGSRFLFTLPQAAAPAIQQIAS